MNIDDKNESEDKDDVSLRFDLLFILFEGIMLDINKINQDINILFDKINFRVETINKAIVHLEEMRGISRTFKEGIVK